jgi:hypothetical protein
MTSIGHSDKMYSDKPSHQRVDLGPSIPRTVKSMAQQCSYTYYASRLKLRLDAHNVERDARESKSSNLKGSPSEGPVNEQAKYECPKNVWQRSQTWLNS